MSTQSAARSIEGNTRIRRDRWERHDIHHSIKGRKIPLCQIQNVLLYKMLHRTLILMTCKRRNLMSACHKLLNNRTACLSIGCHNCNFHHKFLHLIYIL